MYIVGILRQSFNPQLFLTLMFQVFSPPLSTVATVQVTVHSTVQEAGLLELHLTDPKMMMRIVRMLRLFSILFCHLKIVTTQLCDITCRCRPKTQITDIQCYVLRWQDNEVLKYGVGEPNSQSLDSYSFPFLIYFLMQLNVITNCLLWSMNIYDLINQKIR